MREVRVVLNDAVPSRDGDLPVRLAGPEPTFDLRVERIERWLSRKLDDLPLDLLEIAATVFAADSSISRGGRVRSGFGEARTAGCSNSSVPFDDRTSGDDRTWSRRLREWFRS